MALKNGQLPDDVLVTVGKDYYGRPARFRPEAAASVGGGAVTTLITRAITGG